MPVEQQQFTVLHVSHPRAEGESEQRAPFCRERKIQVWENRGMGAQLLVRDLSPPDHRRNPKKVGTLTGITLGSGRGMLQLRAVSHGPVAPFRVAQCVSLCSLSPARRHCGQGCAGPTLPSPQPLWSGAVEQAAGALATLQLRESVFPQSSSRLSFPRVLFKHLKSHV